MPYVGRTAVPGKNDDCRETRCEFFGNLFVLRGQSVNRGPSLIITKQVDTLRIKIKLCTLITNNRLIFVLSEKLGQSGILTLMLRRNYVFFKE